MVWGGFADNNDIREAAHDFLHPHVLTSADHRWIDDEIARAWEAKLAAETHWPNETTFDRLDAVFEALDRQGIIALHHAGMTQSDGASDAAELWHQRGAENSGLKGFAFYHSQDVDTVLAIRVLHLGFGTFPCGGADDIEIAAAVVAALSAAGFSVVAPETAATRIQITDLDWTKRSPAD